MDYSYWSSERNGEDETLYRTAKVKREMLGDTGYQYTYDNMGNIVKIVEGVRAEGTETTFSSSGRKVTYEYDEKGQLTREYNVYLGKTIVYNYDNNGNLKTKKEYSGGQVKDLSEKTLLKTITYGYASSGWTDQLTSYDGESIVYDSMGNPTTYRGKEFGWKRRQLRSLELEDGTKLTYKYDADGLRTKKTVGSESYDYYYANGLLVYEDRGDAAFYYFYDASGNLARIQRVTDIGYAGYYTTVNMRGDVEGIYDYKGELVARYIYDSWGKIISVQNADGEEITSASHIGNQNPIRYRGYYYDAETGFYYVSSRYYDPEVGRWINADTTDVLSLPYYHPGQYNLFSYCNNNPVNDRDDDGQLSWLAKIAIGGAAIAIGVGVTAFTGGAALPALVAGVKAACVAGAISAGTSATKTTVRSVASGDSFSTVVQKSAKSAVDGFADGFMAGGIAAGASQVVSGGFKIAAKLGVKTGKSGGIKRGNTKILSPDAVWQKNNGGTLLKIGKTFRIDVGSNTLLHMHIPKVSSHIQIGTIGAGIYGGLK